MMINIWKKLTQVMEQKTKHINWIHILVILVLMLISISYSIKTCEEIDNKKSSTYEVSEIRYVTKTVQNDTIETHFKPFDKNLLQYIVTLETVPNIDGNIGYEIYDENNKTLKLVTSGLINMTQVKESNCIILDLNGAKLNEGKNYKAVLYFQLNNNLDLRVKSDGNLSDKQVAQFTYGNVYKGVIIGLNIILFIILMILLIKSNIIVSFLVLAIITGVLGIIIIPPYTAPDELRHFARAYDISEGNIIVEEYKTSEDFLNMTFPVCNNFPIEFHNLKLISENSGHGFQAETNNLIVYKQWIKMFQTDYSGETVITPIQGTDIISPIAYLPQIIFILLAKLLNLMPIFVFYMARLGNVITSTILGYIAIKKIPRFKNIIFFLYFAPGLIFLRSTSSTDGFLFSLVILFLSYAIYLKDKNNNKIVIKDTLILLTLLVFIALIKLPYILCGLILIGFDKNFKENIKIKNIARKIVYTLGLIITAATIYKISTVILTQKFAISSTAGSDDIIYLLEHPVKVINMIFQFFLNDTYACFCGAIQFPTCNNLVGIYIFGLILTSIFSYNDNYLTKFNKIYIVLLSSFMWIAILFIFYIVGPSPDLGYIWGVQGRYLFPILPLVCLALSIEKDTIREQLISKYIGLFFCALSIVYFMCIYSNYWI